MKNKRKNSQPRRVIMDNIATHSAPIYRLRIATPLTLRTIRMQYLEILEDVPETEREAWMQQRLQPLDKMLSEAEALALENWLDCEDWLVGNSRVADISGDRVQTSRANMTPLPDAILPLLHWHQRNRKRIDCHDRALLAIFVSQMRGDRDAPSGAEIGCRFFPQARNKAQAYFQALADISRKLVEFGY